MEDDSPPTEAHDGPHSLSYAAAHGTVAAFEPGPRWSAVRAGIVWIEWGVISWVLGLVLAVVFGFTMNTSAAAAPPPPRGPGGLPTLLLASVALIVGSHALIVVGLAMCVTPPPGLKDGRLPIVSLALFGVAALLNLTPLLDLPDLSIAGVASSAVATWFFTRYLMRIAKLLKRRDLRERAVLVNGGLVMIFVLIGTLFVSLLTVRLGWGAAYLGIVAIMMMCLMGLVVLIVYVLLLHRTAAVIRSRLRVAAD